MVAILDGELTVKRLQVTESGVTLGSENPAYRTSRSRRCPTCRFEQLARAIAICLIRWKCTAQSIIDRPDDDPTISDYGRLPIIAVPLSMSKGYMG